MQKIKRRRPKMPPFQRTDGTASNSRDPKRLIWYGPCGHWTDNWRVMEASTIPSGITVTGPGGVKTSVPGPPICPLCQCPGFQAEYDRWWEAAEQHEVNGHPGYLEKLRAMKLPESPAP